jgi:hypothetical protein
MKMRKILLISFVIIMLSSVCVFAGSITIGGKASGGIGFLSGSDWKDSLDFLGADNGSHFGFSIGAYAEIGIIEQLAIQPEILYSNKGGGYSYNIGFEVKGKVSASGLEIPVYVKPKFKMGTGTLYGLIGPDFYLIFGDVKYKETGGGLSVTTDVPPDNSFIFGLSGGLGYEYPLKTGSIDIALKYNTTLSKIYENDNTRLNDVSLSIGFLNRK